MIGFEDDQRLTEVHFRLTYEEIFAETDVDVLLDWLDRSEEERDAIGDRMQINDMVGSQHSGWKFRAGDAMAHRLRDVRHIRKRLLQLGHPPLDSLEAKIVKQENQIKGLEGQLQGMKDRAAFHRVDQAVLAVIFSKYPELLKLASIEARQLAEEKADK